MDWNYENLQSLLSVDPLEMTAAAALLPPASASVSPSPSHPGSHYPWLDAFQAGRTQAGPVPAGDVWSPNVTTPREPDIGTDLWRNFQHGNPGGVAGLVLAQQLAMKNEVVPGGSVSSTTAMGQPPMPASEGVNMEVGMQLTPASSVQLSPTCPEVMAMGGTPVGAVPGMWLPPSPALGIGSVLSHVEASVESPPHPEVVRSAPNGWGPGPQPGEGATVALGAKVGASAPPPIAPIKNAMPRPGKREATVRSTYLTPLVTLRPVTPAPPSPTASAGSAAASTPYTAGNTSTTTSATAFPDPTTLPPTPTTASQNPDSIIDDRRKRNTAASARFRLRKKAKEHKMQQETVSMREKIVKLEGRVAELEGVVARVTGENELLRKGLFGKEGEGEP